MSVVKGLLARLRSLRTHEAERRMQEEFQFHVEMETQRLVRAGVSPDDARRRALIGFGGVDRHSEAMRDGRGARWLNDFRADVRYALRTMRRRPGFAIATAITLGVGIGLNGVVFGYVNSMLFRPIPAHAPEQLVALFGLETRTGRARAVGYEDFLDFRDRSGAFAGLAGFEGIPLNLVAPGATGDGAADMVWGEMVTENYFTVLQMRPAAGRFFTAADAPQGANAFAVLSYESWQTRFGGDPAIAGRVVRLNGHPFTITGVAPKIFRGMRTFGFWPEIFVPAGMHLILRPGSQGLLSGRGGGWMMTVGRMNPGWDRRRTEIAAAGFASQLQRSYPGSNEGMSAMVIPARVGFDNPSFVKPRVLVLASALGIFASLLTLMIICANLANIQLARAAERRQEIAIRLSLGGSRSRLVRQLLIESAVLATPGVLIALALPFLTTRLEQTMVPQLQFQVGLNAAPDVRVMLLTAGVALLGVALFGLVPAYRGSRADLAQSLSSVVGNPRRAARAPRLRATLVVAQLAFSVILLVGGGLFVRSLHMARSSDLGFDPSNRVLMSVNVGLQGYDEPRGRRYYDDVLARVRGLPSVRSAAWTFPVPFDTYGRGTRFYVEGAATNARDGTVATDLSYVSEGFVDALGLRLEGGRSFTPLDSAGAPRTMVVSRELAARLWPGKDPIGRVARVGNAEGEAITVIGIVDDATFALVGGSTTTRAYLSLRQRYRDWETLVVHTRDDASSMAAQIERVVSGADPALPVFGVMTMAASVASGLSTSRTAARIAGFFGLLGLLIAAAGLYAVVASSVAERTREIGLRMALGATPRGAMRHVMRGGARLGAIGLVIGLVGSVAVARLMAGLLFGLSPSDPVTFVAVPLTLALVVLLATYLPARRVTRLDPVAALRTLGLVMLIAIPRDAASAQFKVEKQDVTFASGDLRLAGTLWRPKSDGTVPAAVLIHGSGAAERGELDHLAKFLARTGVAALAYDKRGVGTSQGPEHAWRDFSFDDLAGDALAGVEFLRTQPRIDGARVGLVAVSQGGWVAPLAAARSAGRVRFLIVQSASVTTVAEDNLFERSARLKSEGFTDAEVEEARRMHLVDLDVSRSGARLDEFVKLWNENRTRRWFRRVYLGEEPMGTDHRYRVWYRTVMDFDPVPSLRAVDVPVLWLFGDPALDRFGPVSQSVKVLESLRGEGKPYEIHVFPGADHSLQLPRGRQAPYEAVIQAWLEKLMRRFH